MDKEVPSLASWSSLIRMHETGLWRMQLEFWLQHRTRDSKMMTQKQRRKSQGLRLSHETLAQAFSLLMVSTEDVMKLSAFLMFLMCSCRQNPWHTCRIFSLWLHTRSTPRVGLGRWQETRTEPSRDPGRFSQALWVLLPCFRLEMAL